MRFWREMSARAWGEAAKAVNLESRERVIVALLIQAVIAAGIFIWGTDPEAGMLVRALTAAAPFLLFPLLFVWKWICLPPALAEQLAAPNAPQEAADAVAKAFVTKTDAVNKLAAIDAFRALYNNEILRVQREANVIRNALSQKELVGDEAAKKVLTIKEGIFETARRANELANEYRHYPALANVLSSSTGDKEPLFRAIDILHLALRTGADYALTMHVAEAVWRWMEAWAQRWGFADAGLVKVRALLSA
jgi:hypothetical protein